MRLSEDRSPKLLYYGIVLFFTFQYIRDYTRISLDVQKYYFFRCIFGHRGQAFANSCNTKELPQNSTRYISVIIIPREFPQAALHFWLVRILRAEIS